MKEQIKEIIWGDEHDAVYTLLMRGVSSASIEERRDGKSKNTPVPGSVLNQVLEDITQLAEGNPDAAPTEPPRFSKLILEDDTVIHLPYDKMQPIMDGAWLDANCFMQSIINQPLMGLVACPTEPPITAMMGFNGLGMMGMGEMEPMMQQKPSARRNDDGTWTCGCGASGLTSKFCPECGSQAPPASWDCPNCGAKALTSKFCPECGTPVPPIA